MKTLAELAAWWDPEGYEYEKPVFQMLVERNKNPDPKPQPDVAKALAALQSATALAGGITGELTQAEDTLH